MPDREPAPEKYFKFTEARIRDLPLPPAGRRYTFYDTMTPVLECRVTSAGSKTFSVYYWSKIHAAPLRISLGRWPSLTVEEARNLVPGHIAEILKGSHPTKTRRASRDALTLGQAMRGYIDWLSAQERKPNTIAIYNYFAERFLGNWANKGLSVITPELVISLRAKVRDKDGQTTAESEPQEGEPETRTRPKKPDRRVSANRVLRFLSQVFNHSIRMGWKGTNPCNGVKPFPETPRTRRLEDSEIGPFINACEALREQGDCSVDYLLLCLYTGVRRTNVGAARWEDISLPFGVWNIPDTKNNLPHRVYLSSPAKELLQRRLKASADSPFVFPAESASGHLEEPRKLLKRVLKLAGIDSCEFSVHTLKHTFVSAAYECGLNPVVVSRLGGHKIKGITARYGHTSDQRVREAYEQVAGYLLGRFMEAEKFRANG